MKNTFIIACFVTVMVITAGCAKPVTTPLSSGQPQTMTMQTMQPQTPAPLTDEQIQQLAVGKADHKATTLTFNVSAGSFYFAPNEIHVKKGDTIKIILTNNGGHHDFTLDEFGVKIGAIDGGQTASAEFVADKTGTFEYYCSVGKHRQMGQKGKLIVE